MKQIHIYGKVMMMTGKLTILIHIIDKINISGWIRPIKILQMEQGRNLTKCKIQWIRRKEF